MEFKLEVNVLSKVWHEVNFPLKLVYLTYKLMTNLKIYQICHNLITYFVTLTSPKKVNWVLYLGPEGV